MKTIENKKLIRFLEESRLESNQPVAEIKEGNLLLHHFLFRDFDQGLIFLSRVEDGDCIAIPVGRVDRVMINKDLVWQN